MSNIDPSKPTEGQATTQSVRDNFSAAATEIDANAADIATNAAAIAAIPDAATVFDAKLAGYLDTGILEQWNTNVDDISVNSAYGVNAAVTTGLPSDFEASWQGEITTLFRTATRATQMLYGVVNTSGDTHKIWMRNLNTTWDVWKLVVDGGYTRYYGKVSSSTGLITLDNGGTTGTRNSVGDYTITLDSAFPDASYSATMTPAQGTAVICSINNQLANVINIRTFDANNALADRSFNFLLTRDN